VPAFTVRVLPALAATALIGAGCGSDSGSSDRAGEATPNTVTTESKPAAKPPPAKGTTIRLAGSQYGQVLFDRAGQAIYLFAKEKSAKAECYEACAAAWPPVVTKGEPQAARGINQGLLGTTKRADGKSQVTYNGHPLYYYAHEGRNEVRCHNVSEFGGLWLVLDRKGNALD
jgi:predicted lipoprotein with Yx(FWY)xxD motif